MVGDTQQKSKDKAVSYSDDQPDRESDHLWDVQDRDHLWNVQETVAPKGRAVLCLEADRCNMRVMIQATTCMA